MFLERRFCPFADLRNVIVKRTDYASAFSVFTVGLGDNTVDYLCISSRFDKTGYVIYDPAIENLKEPDLS